MNSRALAACAAVLLMGAALWYQHQTINRLRADTAVLLQIKSDAEQLRAENKQLTSYVFDREEFERLKGQESELLRLRGEVGRLKKQLVKANSAKVPIALEEAEVSVPVLTTNDFMHFATNFTAEVQNGETLVTGRWTGDDGQQTLVFVTPSLIDASGRIVKVADANTQVTMEASFATLTAEVAERIAGTINMDHFSDEEFRSLLKTFKETEGVEFMSAPKITTLSGRETSASSIELHGPKGNEIPAGLTVNFIPTISAGGTGCTLGGTATFTRKR